MSGKRYKRIRKNQKFNLLLSMLVMQDDELYADLSELQKRKRDGLIDEEAVMAGIKVITEKIMDRLDGKKEIPEESN